MKKLIGLLLSATVLLSSVSVSTFASTAVPAPFSGNFDVAFFGNSHPNYHTNSTTWMSEVRKSIAESTGITTTGKSYGSFNANNAWISIGTMIDAEPELVLIDTAIMRNSGTGSGYMEGKYLESVLQSLARLKNAPYVALIDGVDSTLTKDAPAYTEALAELYGVDYIDLSKSGVDASCFTGTKANDSAYAKYASYVLDQLTYKQIKLPQPSQKLYSTSYPTSPRKIYSGTLTDETKIIEFEGSSLFIKTIDDASTTTKLDMLIDTQPSSITDPNGVCSSNYNLTNTHHVLQIKATGTLNIEGVYADCDSLVGGATAIGFEDNYSNYVLPDHGTAQLVNEGADGSSYSIKLKNTENNGEIKIPMALQIGKEYKVSAKVKPITFASGNTVTLIHYQQRKDSNGNLTANSGWTTQSIGGLTVGKWQTVSGIIKSTDKTNIGGGNTDTASDYGMVSLRFGNAGNEVLVDDIIVEPIEAATASASFEMNFNDKTYSVPGYATSINVGGGYSYVDDGNGGYALHASKLTAYQQLVNIQYLLLKPNGIYKISFRARATDEASVGKYIQPIVDRSSSHTNDSGTTPFNKLGNYFYPEAIIQLTQDWQTVTCYYNTTNILTTDELGYARMYFRLHTGAASAGLGTETVNFDFDDLAVEEINIPNGALLSAGQKPNRNNLNCTYDTDNNIIYAKGAVVNSDIVLGLPFDNNTKYKLTFDINGPEGMTIKPILSGYLRNSNGDGTYSMPEGSAVPSSEVGQYNYYFYGDGMSLDGTWQSYSCTFNYKTGIHRYPQVLIRTVAGSGDYAIKNIRFEKVLESGISSIEASNLIQGDTCNVSIGDYASTSKGYAYTIYATNDEGKRVVYASGSSATNNIKFPVSAPVGTTLYAKIASVDSEGNRSDYVTECLGEVTPVEFDYTITPGFDDSTGDINGVVAYKNNNEARSINSYIVQYDADDKILCVTCNSIEVEPLAEDSLITPIELDESVESIKMFVWDNNGMPYTNTIIYE